jgi:DNA polymerase-1
VSKQLLILDGDHILHRCCAAAEHEDKWDEDNRVLVTNVEEAWDTTKGSIENVLEHFGERNHVIAMGSGPYFRHELEPNYKGGRGRKPLGYHDVKERLMENYKVVSMPGIEADDVMGILATKPNSFDKIIVARDKDMKSVPGKLWDGRQFKIISTAEADYWHMYQTLVGDRTDNYPGCPGMGQVKAEKLLDNLKTTDGLNLTWDYAVQHLGLEAARECVWKSIVEAFTNAGLTEADALKQARIARILRWADWDSERKQPILWTPTKCVSSK